MFGWRLSLAHVSGIFVQTCGRSLGESMSHSSLPLGSLRRVNTACALGWRDLLATFLYITLQWEIRALCHIRHPDSARVLPVMITTLTWACESMWTWDSKCKNGRGKKRKGPSISCCLTRAWWCIASPQSGVSVQTALEPTWTSSAQSYVISTTHKIVLSCIVRQQKGQREYSQGEQHRYPTKPCFIPW